MARNLDEVMAITQNSTCDSVIVLCSWMTRIQYEVMQITQNSTWLTRTLDEVIQITQNSITVVLPIIMYYHGNNTDDIICHLIFAAYVGL